MIFIESLFVALSTYSIIPVPNFNWNEKNMKYAICFFPVVGLLCGIFTFALIKLITLLKLSNFFGAIFLICIPLLLTGGIHMDGFMDTVDAISSHRSKERKLEILSDPHVGAFAVIYCIIYILSELAFLFEIRYVQSLFVLCPLYVLSRCISSICAVNLPNAKKTGMLSTYTKSAKRKIVNIEMGILSFICAVLMIVISPVSGICALVSGAIWTLLYIRMVMKQFGGVTGDTAGFFLQMFELCAIAGIWIGGVL